MSNRGTKDSKKIVTEWDRTDPKNQQQSSLFTIKRDFPEIGHMTKKPNLKKNKSVSSNKEISIQEIKNLVRNPKQFIWVYGVELGYHLPPKAYVTWPFIIAVLQGKTKLLKSAKISLTIQVPKLEQLSMRRVWPRVRDSTDLRTYMPLLGPGRYPPRKFFYEILHTRYRSKFDNIIAEAKQERPQEMLKNKLIVKVDPNMLDELRNCSIWSDISSSQVSKRVSVNRISRGRTNN